MAVWKLAPALAARQRRRAQARRADPGVDHVPDGPDRATCCRRACSTSSTASASRRASRWRRRPRIRKIAFTGETTTGRLIMQYASAEPHPGDPGARRQEPEHLLRRRRGAPTTTSTTRRSRASRCSPSTRARSAPARRRALIQAVDLRRRSWPTPSSAPRRSSRATRSTPTRMIGAQASTTSSRRSCPTSRSARRRAPRCSPAASAPHLDGDLAGGYYVQPTIFEGDNSMRIFQEEIFGPVVSVTTFADYDDAIKIANDTLYGLGAGVWSRDSAHRLPRGPRHPGRPGVDELLPRLPGARGVRRLQGLGHRPREPPDDARPLPADQEPAGQLQPERSSASSDRPPVVRGLRAGLRRAAARVLDRQEPLGHPRRGAAEPLQLALHRDRPGPPTARRRQREGPTDATRTRRRGSPSPPRPPSCCATCGTDHGPLMFHQSGGCCDGSSPMCYPAGDFITGDADVHLGDLDIGGTGDAVDAGPGVDVPQPVRVLEAHPPDHRRRARPRRRVLPRGAHRAAASSSGRGCSPTTRPRGSRPAEDRARPAG